MTLTETLAAQLDLNYKPQPALIRGGRVLYPALALFTVKDTASPAYGATFSVRADAVSLLSLLAALTAKEEEFAAALA